MYVEEDRRTEAQVSKSDPRSMKNDTKEMVESRRPRIQRVDKNAQGEER